MTGSWPSKDIDHKDGNRSNNKWNNLREATGTQNNGNKGLNSNNTSGVRGVYFHIRRKKWIAQMQTKTKKVYLGIFVNKKDAEIIAIEAQKKYFGEFFYE